MKSFSIGKINIDPPLVLAPMAGITHSPFRRLVASFGKPGLFYSEMLDARRLAYEEMNQALSLKRSGLEQPAAYQIFASNTEDAVHGCRKLVAGGAEIIDLNMGCSSSVIARRKKSGSYLLSDLVLAEQMLTGMRRAITARPLTVKIRLGKKPDLHFLRDMAGLLENCGVDAVTLHPRLTTEKLKRRARWDYIGHLKTMTSLPVIGNGDVTSKEECEKMFRDTGCDGVMIGRAAVRQPWLFGEICGREIEVTPEFLYATYRNICRDIIDFFPEKKALGRIKEVTWHFSQNLKFGHRLAARMQMLPTVQACLQMSEENFLKAA